jgi:hypothetical protein
MGSCGDAPRHSPPHRRRRGPADVSPVPGANRIEHLAQAVAERVVSAVMDTIDINAILAHIDINAILERVDVNALVDEIDVNKLIEKVDFQEIIDKIDIDALVEHTEIGTIIAKSTSSVAMEALDVVRSQGVGLDDFVARWVNRILRRDPAKLPLGPPLLVSGNQQRPELTSGAQPAGTNG